MAANYLACLVFIEVLPQVSMLILISVERGAPTPGVPGGGGAKIDTFA